MPGKHVRIDERQNEYFSPRPEIVAIPSRHHSSTSSGSSSHHGSSHHSSLRPVGIHRLLSAASPALIQVDLRQSAHHYIPTISSTFLARPATEPPLPRLTLVSSHLPWRVHVDASNGRAVTVQDVLAALSHTLRAPVTEAEFHTLLGHSDRRRAAAAYTERYRRAGTPEEKRAGLRRVDFLMSRYHFAGLEAVRGHGDVWALCVR
ncbi:hypothetical protein BD626DRAFT_431131 [Schizophyllum amplum]|uniref:DUF6699 domain-containing protein n=1 Tax=Schizophyllum amplum TaxID=97359 RepID=A0A550CF26_9AGAR|nr:hypothetical protein BD626DRAFT_431131 [Auriculariopsis ampla]